jgi:predicted nucleic acid-binding protein
MTTILDTNIVIALMKHTDHFHSWAVEQLKYAKRDNPPAAICDTSFAEASVAYDSAADLTAALIGLGIDRLPTSDDALYMAGQTFRLYRGRGGKRDGVLPDFIIGAVAKVENIPLMTANSKDFTKNFEGLILIEPPKADLAGAVPIVT